MTDYRLPPVSPSGRNPAAEMPGACRFKAKLGLTAADIRAVETAARTRGTNAAHL